MSCAFRDLNAPLVQRPTPGPLPGAAVPPGGSNKQPMKLANKGTQPMTLKVGFKQAAQAVWKLIFPTQAAVMAADATADFTLAPEETLEFEIECSPQAAGMTTATLEIQTSDPVNPLLTYDLSCEGVLPPLPEKLAFGSSFGTGLPSRRMIGIALNPAGNLLLSGNWDAAGVTAWNVDPANGNLLNPAVVARPGTTNVGMIDFSPDGLDAYYTTQSQDGVVQVRTPPGGPIQVGQAFTRTTPYSCVDANNQPDICTLNSMDGTRGLDVSPDGANVYVAGANDNALTIFSRDPGTGALSPLEVLKNNVDGVAALTNPIGVLVSNDGQNVYVANASSNRLSVFSRT
ncbi:MAG: beta-propeller fold lactonase family protein, partial [Caldilineaceae bacterium]